MSETGPIGEELVCSLWSGQHFRRENLLSEDGDAVEVTFPGERNLSNRGPDFRGAELLIGTSPVRGDVEVHVRPSDWYLHGHHRDGDYNGVVLHVAMLRDERYGRVTRADGVEIPTLVLEGYLLEDVDELLRAIGPGNDLRWEGDSEVPCRAWERWRFRDRGKLGDELEKLGLERLILKANRFRRRMRGRSIDQVLYEGLMQAFGYDGNKLAFLRLSETVSLATIERSIGKLAPSARRWAIEAMLLGAAGLLPEEGTFDPETGGRLRRLRSFWGKLGDGIGGPALSRSDWSFFRARPANSPTRRIAAMSGILSNYIDRGIFSTFLSAFEPPDTVGPAEALNRLEKLFSYDDPYWSFHADFGGRRFERPLRLIGTERISDAVVNIVIPLTYAYAREVKRGDLLRGLRRIYLFHPKLADNRITRKMRARIFGERYGGGKAVNSAARMQGLIHLHRRFCEKGRCPVCPLVASSG